MNDMDRRGFLKGTAGALAAAALMPGARGAAAALPKPADMRTLGKTGISCSYLGVGTGVRGSAPGITAQSMALSGSEYVGMLEHAYRKGVRYFDLADRYGSHHYMSEAMRRSVPRDEVMLLSKVWSREPEAVRRDLERMRGELSTDRIDVVLMHCIREGEENWPETLRGAMDVLEEAKAKGHIRAHGVSATASRPSSACPTSRGWTWSSRGSTPSASTWTAPRRRWRASCSARARRARASSA